MADKPYIHYVVLLLIGVAVAGSWVGMPANYGALKERGFCSENLQGEALGKPDQRSCLAVPSNAASSLLNFLALPFGILTDLAPLKWCYVAANLMLLVGTNFIAYDSNSGLGYSFALPLCCAGCMLLFMVAVGQLIPKLVPARHVGLVRGLYTSSWDAGVAAAPIMGLLLKWQDRSAHGHAYTMTITMVFFCISLAVLPTFSGIMYSVDWNSDVSKDENEEQENDEVDESAAAPAAVTVVAAEKKDGENEEDDSEPTKVAVVNETTSLVSAPKSPAPEKDSVYTLLTRSLRYRQLWSLTCCSIPAVAYGYFVLANVNQFVMSSASAPGYRADSEETHDFGTYASILMGLLAPVAIIPVEKMYAKYGWLKTIRLIGLVQALLLIIITALVSCGMLHWQYQYVTWILIIMVRMSAFGTVTIGWGEFCGSRNDYAVAGTGLGIAYTIGGGASLIGGYVSTKLVQHDVEGGNMFRIVHGVFAGVCVVLHLIQSFTIVDDVDSNHQQVDGDEADKVVKGSPDLPDSDKKNYGTITVEEMKGMEKF